MKLSPSALRTWQECPRKYQYTYFNRRIPTRETGAMSFGTAFHAGLDYYWQHMDPFGAVKVMWDHLEYDRFKVFADVLMHGYHQRWRDSGYQFVEAESEKEVTVGGLTLRGIWDKIARDPRGDLCIVEHKTTSSSIKPEDTYWVYREQEDVQVDTYLLMARELSFDIKYVLYDVIQVPKLKPYKATPRDKLQRYKTNSKYGRKGDLKKGQRLNAESPVDFRKRVADIVMKNSYDMFVRKKFYRTTADLKRMAEDIQGVRSQIIHAGAEGQLPRCLASCFNYRKECEYLPVCREETTLNNNELFKDKE